MNGYQSVSQTAKDLGVTNQTVRNWIENRDLIAFRAMEGSPYRVAIVSVEAMKRRLGLSPMPSVDKVLSVIDLTD